MPQIEIKTPEEIQIMRESGRISFRVLNELEKHAVRGANIKDLDLMAEKIILDAGAKPSFKGFHGYPATTCISINEQVVHGIPGNRVLVDGDIVGFDIGVYLKGFHTDTAITVAVGKVSSENRRLIEVTKKSLERGLKKVRAGVHIGDVQAEIQNEIEKNGFEVIRDLTGHGVGRELQEEPSIPNYGKKGTGFVLKEGMTLAFEPMTAMMSSKVEVLSDGWTIVTYDGHPSAHFEHTILVTKHGCEVLTK